MAKQNPLFDPYQGFGLTPQQRQMAKDAGMKREEVFQLFSYFLKNYGDGKLSREGVLRFCEENLYFPKPQEETLLPFEMDAEELLPGDEWKQGLCLWEKEKTPPPKINSLLTDLCLKNLHLEISSEELTKQQTESLFNLALIGYIHSKRYPATSEGRRTVSSAQNSMRLMGSYVEEVFYLFTQTDKASYRARALNLGTGLLEEIINHTEQLTPSKNFLAGIYIVGKGAQLSDAATHNHNFWGNAEKFLQQLSAHESMDLQTLQSLHQGTRGIFEKLTFFPFQAEPTNRRNRKLRTFDQLLATGCVLEKRWQERYAEFTAAPETMEPSQLPADWTKQDEAEFRDALHITPAKDFFGKLLTCANIPVDRRRFIESHIQGAPSREDILKNSPQT